ncbi:hypothetical protein A1Q5_04680 [Aliivibrio logei 5S-186]|uniref:Uncharacterized protein n=1 Tax=Aliivibrio logei 5S-186 TaxID=626086 RepID=A0ABX3AZ49_ALILO|nr:hypothetical protein A1Q5_04680 [Aliivibrio logei 5S-186]
MDISQKFVMVSKKCHLNHGFILLMFLLKNIKNRVEKLEISHKKRSKNMSQSITKYYFFAMKIKCGIIFLEWRSTFTGYERNVVCGYFKK